LRRETDITYPLFGPLICPYQQQKETISNLLGMEQGTIHLHKPISHQLKKVHAPFAEVTKEKFNEYGGEQGNQLQKLRPLIYRTTDIELKNGDSRVTFYNLCYLKGLAGTKYYVSSEVTVVVPPWNFLGDKEETTIVQWLSRDKGKFLRQSRSSKNQKLKMPPALTEGDRREIQECMKIFEEQPEYEQFETVQVANNSEMPNFNLGFDFLSEMV